MTGTDRRPRSPHARNRVPGGPVTESAPDEKPMRPAGPVTESAPDEKPARPAGPVTESAPDEKPAAPGAYPLRVAVLGLGEAGAAFASGIAEHATEVRGDDVYVSLSDD